VNNIKSLASLHLFRSSLFYFIFIVLGGGTLWHLQKFLQCTKDIGLL
jgi:hypothetical protein